MTDVKVMHMNPIEAVKRLHKLIKDESNKIDAAHQAIEGYNQATSVR